MHNRHGTAIASNMLLEDSCNRNSPQLAGVHHLPCASFLAAPCLLDWSRTTERDFSDSPIARPFRQSSGRPNTEELEKLLVRRFGWRRQVRGRRVAKYGAATRAFSLVRSFHHRCLTSECCCGPRAQIGSSLTMPRAVRFVPFAVCRSPEMQESNHRR